MTFTLAVASGIANAPGASFVLGSTLTRPFTRKRPAHEERRIHYLSGLSILWAVDLWPGRPLRRPGAAARRRGLRRGRWRRRNANKHAWSGPSVEGAT